MKRSALTLFGALFSFVLPSAAQQNVYGCPVQPSDSIFYSRIDSLPVLSQSATYTANMGTPSLTWDSSLGVTVSNSSAPTIYAQFNYTPSYNGVWRYPAYYAVDRQSGSLGGNYPADHHTIIVDADTCTVWETYHAYVNTADGSIETGNTCNGKPCNAQSGWTYNGTSYNLPTQGTTDAAGLPLLPLIWRGHEILDGTLTHAVRLSLARGYIQAGNPLWPASGTNGWGKTNNPPYGTRFRVKASATFTLTGLTAQQQVYAQRVIGALQNYGLVLADIGINLNAAIDDEAGQNPDVMAALNKVGSQIKPAQLEAVDLTSLKPSPLSYQNAQSTGATTPVMVGTPYGTYLNIQAGTSLQLQSWVNGPANVQDVTWSVTSGNIGTVTATGLYTPPTSVTGLTSGVLTVTSVADSTASATLYVHVFPAGPIRIAAGLQSGTITDKLKQVWMANVFFRGGDTVYRASDYPNWPVPSNPTQAAELAVYQTFYYTYGNDAVANLIVPNGNYNVRFMFGQPYNGHSPSTCSPFPSTWHDYVSIEAQDTIMVSNFDFGASVNYACATPVDVTIPATVTSNVLELALRNTVPDGQTVGTSPQFNGLEILPAN